MEKFKDHGSLQTTSSDLLLKILQGSEESANGYRLQTFLDVAAILTVTTEEVLQICGRLRDNG